MANRLIESAQDISEGPHAEPLLVVTTHGGEKEDPLMKYLDASTGKATNKIFQSWESLASRYGFSSSTRSNHAILPLARSLAKEWEGRQIVLLLDEIEDKYFLDSIADSPLPPPPVGWYFLEHMGKQNLPDSVRMILILNPKGTGSDSPEELDELEELDVSRKVFTLPPRGRDEVKETLPLPSSLLHVTLTTPYRSTIAITSLARFIARCKRLDVSKGDIGSDVEGTKPIFFDVGRDSTKTKEALEHCRKHLGDNVTILYENVPNRLVEQVESQGKKSGGPCECFPISNFYGWEADRVVAVTDGSHIMELITRARTHLAVILVKKDDKKFHSGLFIDHLYRDYAPDSHDMTRNHFQHAAGQGLVDIVTFPSDEEVSF